MGRIHVAVVSDAPLLLLGLGAILRQDKQLQVVTLVHDLPDVARATRQLPCHVLLVHTATPALTAPRVMVHASANFPAAKVLLLTEQAGRPDLVSALRAGVHGYAVLGDLSPDELCRGVVTLAHQGLWTCSVSTRLLLRDALLDDAAEGRTAVGPTAPDGRARSGLSNRELVVLRKAASGQGETQIARDLSISPNTVKMYFRRICEKLQATSRAEAIEMGGRLGLVPVGYSSAGRSSAVPAAMIT